MSDWHPQPDWDRAEQEERARYRMAVDDAYLAHLAAMEAEAQRYQWVDEYEPEDDPYHGETTARYEEGNQP